MIPQGFKPMKGAALKSDLSDLKLPAYFSTKLDGVRIVHFDGVAHSNSMKPIRNRQIQAWAKENAELLHGLDGEIILGEPDEPGVLRRTNGFQSSYDKEFEDWTFYVFDIVPEAFPDKCLSGFVDRQHYLHHVLPKIPRVIVLKNYLVHTQEEAVGFVDSVIIAGFEGGMFRSVNGGYKYGKSSVKEGIMNKAKPFTDSEFLIVGYTEKMHNANEAYTDELGRTKRSTAKENLVPMGTLGAIVCQVSSTDTRTFNVGTGFDDDLRARMWAVRETLPGQMAKVKFMTQGKNTGIPELPVFLDIRDPNDMTE